MIETVAEELANWIKLGGHSYSFAGYLCSVISLIITTIVLWQVRHNNGKK